MASDDDKTKAESGSHGDSHDHGHDHGDSHAAGHEVGEAFVPTTSWQDMLLNAVGGLCLLGLIQMMYFWLTLPLPPVAAEGTEHAVEK